MAREPDSIVTLSVFDRLIDREPHTQVEGQPTRSQSVRALKAALRRDIEWLLNTRRNPDEVPEQYQQLSQSLYNYGLPDFTTFTFASSKDRGRLLRMIESTIRTFEPRLASVKVNPIESGGNDSSRTIRFQIEGLLLMDPAPEQVTFDTVLQLTSGEYQVKGERGA